MSSHPLVSILLVAYNQEIFIREAVRSAFAQTYENLEIVLSDDSSLDQTFEIMREEASHYKGPHKLILNRNSSNFGLAGNLNRAFALASGELLIQQDGDDISFPIRVSTLVQRWASDEPRPDLVYSRAIHIGQDGNVLPRQNTPMRIATLHDVARGEFYVAGAAVSAYSRGLFEKFGPLNPAIVYTDYVLTFRALLGSGCAFIDAPLVYYRRHPESITGSLRLQETRGKAAQWAKHFVAEQEDRLRALTVSRKRNLRLRRRLSRDFSRAKLEFSSSTGSRLGAVRCVIWALLTAKPRIAWLFLRRDVLKVENEG